MKSTIASEWDGSSTATMCPADPLGFEAGDANLTRYVGNSAPNFTDPTGLQQKPWKRIAELLGYKWTAETCDRAGDRLARELLEKLVDQRPDSETAQEIIKALKDLGWIEEALGQGSKEGLALDEGGGILLREIVDGVRTGRILEWYPGKRPHHEEPHWKFSSPESGTLRNIGGTVAAVAVCLAPGAAEAGEGDWNGAAREAAWSFNPFGVLSDCVSGMFSWLFDSAEESLKANDDEPNIMFRP